MKNMKFFRRGNGIKRISVFLGLAMVFNMVATLPIMAYSIAEYAARIDPMGLSQVLKMAATVPAVAKSVAGGGAGGGGVLGTVMPASTEITIPAHFEWQLVWIPPEEGYPDYWEWQEVWVEEQTKTVWLSSESTSTTEPIDTTTGNNYFTESGLSIPCPGIPLAVGLKYQSVTSHPEGRLGKGWHHSYEWELEVETDQAVIHTATGGKLVFEEDANGLYQSPEESKWELVATTNGYEAGLPAGWVYSFATNGVLTSIRDAWDNRVTCSYGTNGCLESVAHANGRQIAFSNEWNVASNEWRIASMQVPDGVSLAFGYNAANQLAQVVEQVGENSFTSSYQYADSFLTNKVNGAGFEYTFGYEEEGGALNGKGTYLDVDGYYEHEVSYEDFSTDVTYHRRGTNQIFRYSRNTEGKPETTYGPAESIANIEVRGKHYVYATNDMDTIEETLFDDTTGSAWSKWMLYDDAHNVTNFSVSYVTTNPVQLLSMEYDPVSQLATSVLDVDNLRLEVVYTNGLPLVEKAFYSASNSYDTCYSYATNGLVQAVTNANLHVVNFGHDSMGNPVFTAAELGPVATNTFDAHGFVETTEILSESGNHTGRITQYGNDAKGRVVKITFADGLTNSFAYNALGYLTNSVDRAGRATDFTYAPTEKLTSVTRYLKQGGSIVPVRIGYDLDEQVNVLRISEPRGRYVESYQLDIQDRVTSVTNIEGQVMSIGYAIGGFVTQVGRFDGTSVTNIYDNAGRKKSVTYLSAGGKQLSAASNSYYSDGLIESISDGTSSVSNSYDRLNRLTNQVVQICNLQSAICNLQSEIVNAFDPIGNITNTIISTGGAQAAATAYTYDEAERLTGISAASSDFIYAYNPTNGAVESISNTVSGIATSYEYDLMDHTTNIAYRTANGSLIRSLEYAYDAASMITNKVQASGNGQEARVAYTYDSLNRLVGESSSTNGTFLSDVRYSYDLAGNRLTKTKDDLGVAYTLGDGNRLASARTIAVIDMQGSSSEPIGTDDRWGELWVSNLTAQVGWMPETDGYNFWADNMPLELGTNQLVAALRDQAGNTDYTTNTVYLSAASTNMQYGYNEAGCMTNLNGVALEWDERYRLKSVDGASCSVEYEYDVLNRRTSRIEGSTTNYFVYNGNQVAADLDGTGNLLRTYVWGYGIDNLLSFTDHTTSNTYYGIKDHQNSVIALVDDAGSVVESYKYDAYGNTTIYDSNHQSINSSTVGNRYLFQGREYDSSTGLYYFRSRWYDSSSGRWLSKDPVGIAGGLNLYAAFRNNPINRIDPNGQAPAANAAVITARSDIVAGIVTDLQNSSVVDSDVSKAAGTANISYVNNDGFDGFGITQGPFGGGFYDIFSNPWADGGAGLTPEGLESLVNTIIHELLHESGIGQTGRQHPPGFEKQVREATDKFLNSRVGGCGK